MRTTELVAVLLACLTGFSGRGSSSASLTEVEQAIERPQTLDLSPYRAEIDALAEQIKADHPQPFRLVSEADFDALVAEVKGSIRPEHSTRDTLWGMSAVLASIACSHSKLFYFVREDSLIRPEERFPIDVRYVEGALYVFDPLENHGAVAVGDEITMINGQSVDSLLEKIYRHISADAGFSTSKRHQFNVFATSYLTYALDFPDSYAVTLVGRDDTLALKQLAEFEHAPLVSPHSECQENLCYRVDEPTGMGIMTIRSFNYYGSEGAEFAEFVDRSFGDLFDNERRGLVIDLRDNHGGSGLAGAYILRRIANQPFTYFTKEADPRGRAELFEQQQPSTRAFQGQVHILINGNTSSATPHFAAIAQAYGFATLAGETPGGNHVTFDGKRKFSAPLTGGTYTVARMPFVVESECADPLAPLELDWVIPYSVRETLTRKDEMMGRLLEKIAATLADRR